MGELNTKEYLDRLVGRIYKIIPLREENTDNVKKYISSLVVELKGASRVNEHFSNSGYFQSILYSLGGLEEVTDFNVCKAKVFECITLCNKILQDIRNNG